MQQRQIRQRQQQLHHTSRHSPTSKHKHTHQHTFHPPCPPYNDILTHLLFYFHRLPARSCPQISLHCISLTCGPAGGPGFERFVSTECARNFYDFGKMLAGLRALSGLCAFMLVIYSRNCSWRPSKTTSRCLRSPWGSEGLLRLPLKASKSSSYTPIQSACTHDTQNMQQKRLRVLSRHTGLPDVLRSRTAGGQCSAHGGAAGARGPGADTAALL